MVIHFFVLYTLGDTDFKYDFFIYIYVYVTLLLKLFIYSHIMVIYILIYFLHVHSICVMCDHYLLIDIDWSLKLLIPLCFCNFHYNKFNFISIYALKHIGWISLTVTIGILNYRWIFISSAVFLVSVICQVLSRISFKYYMSGNCILFKNLNLRDTTLHDRIFCCLRDCFISRYYII